MFIEFSNREEMLQYEETRNRYFSDWIAICDRPHILQFYQKLFLEAFHPKHKTIKKKYEEYSGGWYRNEQGIPVAEFIQFFDTDKLVIGEPCLEGNEYIAYKVYIYMGNGEFYRVDLNNKIKELINDC